MSGAIMNNLILPIGTRVVTLRKVRTAAGEVLCPEGAMGVLVKTPSDTTHSYRVRLPSGAEVALQRQDIAVFTRFQEHGLERDARDEPDLYNYVIYRCVIGSRAYGLDNEGSDVDRRGIYLPPADMHWSLSGLPEQLERGQSEEVYWELQKFLTLALKANPNVLECLYTPLVEDATPLAQELLAERERFLSKLVYQTYNGYVLSQFKKMEQDIRNRGEIRWKHAMHLIRLLMSGIAALEQGTVPVNIAEGRESLLSIRRGEMDWDAVNNWRLSLHKDFDKAFANTDLPERPDYRWANRFLNQGAQEHAVMDNVFTRDNRLRKVVESQPYPLLFVTISGAHLYGFPSSDSDYDLRGVHVLPLRDIVGLEHTNNTITTTDRVEELEIDLVSHDVAKFFKLLLKKNGYVLEQLYSPLVIHTTPEHQELKRIAQGCITRNHSYHYFGFAATQWSLFNRVQPGRIKPLLYLYRVLLTGIHLMHTGEVIANLPLLNQEFKLCYLDELIARKLEGPEKVVLEDTDIAFHEREYGRLRAELECATLESMLPEAPLCAGRLNDLLVQIRLSAK